MSESTRDVEPTQAKCSAILAHIGKQHLLHATTLEPNFVWNDFLLPFTKEQLPRDENGSLDYATEFIEEQKRILPEISPKLVHNSFTGNEEPPHIYTKAISEEIQISDSLGHGRWGEVFIAKLQASDGRSNSFAMKLMRKPAPREGRGETRCTVLEFENELKNLSKCRHHHIIDLRASFTDEANFGFIVSPVADRTLQELLGGYLRENSIYDNKADRKALRRAFGCLLDSIRYLHDKLEIRHRDIKPSNILIHNDRVLICDLGSAYDFEPLGRQESTDSRRPPGTRKYKAPEVFASVGPNERQSHNTKVDIFSLGCVFLEMHTVLCEQTLDQMAEYITENKRNQFEGDWTYASSLERADKWLDKLRDSPGFGEGLTGLIRSMLCAERSERKSAQELFQEVCTEYVSYIGKCCKRRSPPDVIPDTLPPTGYLVKSCRIARRELDEAATEAQKYGEYIRFADYSQNGKLDVQNDHRDPAWATTRSIIVKMLEDPRSIEVYYWLPAYYISVTRNGQNVTIGWSDFDHLMKETRSEFERTSTFKVHCRCSSENNLLMELEFDNESAATRFSSDLLTEPIDDTISFEVPLPGHRLLTVREHRWGNEGQRGAGSHVACLQHSSVSEQPSRLEPLFVPHEVDFILSLGRDKTYTGFGSDSFFVPRYRSDQEGMYELPKEKAVFKSVDLVSLCKKRLICFQEVSEIPEGANHLETTKFCNKDLQQFLSILTGWKLLVVFSALDVRRIIPSRLVGRFPRPGPADVLCFRKEQEMRIGIRRKDIEKGYTIDWTLAIVLKVDVDTKKQELDFEMTSRQTGRKVALDTMTAAAVKTENTTEMEGWIITVENDSGELHSILRERGPRQINER